MTLNIVTVQVGNYCERGAEYLERLYDGLRRNLPGVEFQGFCITDDPTTLPAGVEPIEPQPETAGWWHKISMFKPGLFKGRCLSLDLDQIIIDNMTDIASYNGPFAIMRDPYFPTHMNSSLMAWEAGYLDHIWTAWERCGCPQFDPKGDQNWIETMQPEADYWQDLHPGQVVSFKADCRNGVPPDVRTVVFHGKPRPHELNFELPATSQKGN